jgi:biotin transport system substrate-specific component
MPVDQPNVLTARHLQYGTYVSMLADRSGSPALARAIPAAAVLFVTALTAAAAQVSVPMPFTPVPLTLQPMIVLLGAAALGGRLGAVSQALYLAAGVAGLPVFAASPMLPQGAARLFGPTGGYLISYPVAAFVVGWLAERGMDRRYLTALVSMAAGLAVIFSSGVAWLALSLDPVHPARAIGRALAAGFYPFIIADVVKLLVATGALPGVWWLTGRRGSGSR